ncbi:hypothetical protein ACFVVM_18860 [Nocardia sp. NPDC058176]|uniref:hypothetical protein n=1 Tax=Nocardia sp. NPDC058176 TaxID=3346368 RepID=UPI0036D923E5
MEHQGHSLDSAPPAQGTVDPLDHPAPELPGLDQPDTTFTMSPRIASLLRHHNAMRAAGRGTWIIMLALIPLHVFNLTISGMPLPLIVIVMTIPVCAPIANHFQLRRQYGSLVDDAATVAVRLGTDALDITERTCHSRIRYQRIRGITVSARVAVLQVDGRPYAMPRELWPDHLVEELRGFLSREPVTTPDRRVRTPSPLFPALPRPHAVTVADSDTARLLTRAHARAPWWRPTAKTALIGVAVIVGAVVFGWLGGPPAVLIFLVISALIGAVGWWMTRVPSYAEIDKVAGFAAPGAVMATQFGSDAVLIATARFVLRLPYSTIRRITVRGEVATLGYRGMTIVLPGALFPSPIRDRLRERGLRISGR